ncbi:MAG: hypothetical protein EAX87_10825 [Candidatus Thorarchaeota archaeon]|nr:hypothetical protein [Candidatus Thorarchaeota archaeon]
MEKDESDLETAFKVVAIMQAITEDLDEKGRRMWRKMLGQEKTDLGELRTDKKRAVASKSEQSKKPDPAPAQELERTGI